MKKLTESQKIEALSQVINESTSKDVVVLFVLTNSNEVKAMPFLNIKTSAEAINKLKTLYSEHNIKKYYGVINKDEYSTKIKSGMTNKSISDELLGLNENVEVEDTDENLEELF